jgi:hypothetical protein
MILIKPTEPEQKEWDSLVKKFKGTVFSESRYLNALDLDWMICYNEDRSGGMICPFAVKGGRRILINPIYHQFSEWIGEGSIDKKVVEFLKQNFQIATLNVRAEIPEFDKLVHQVVNINNHNINTLSKRMLKKSQHYEIQVNTEIEAVKKLIADELSDRIAGMSMKNLENLENLAKAFLSNGLRSYCAYSEDKFAGGIWILENETQFMYLKGTAFSEAKKDGIIYRMMNKAIEDCLNLNKQFDFGGSNVPSVQRFNYNLGGVDNSYSQLKWNHAPFWWNWMRILKNKIRK